MTERFYRRAARSRTAFIHAASFFPARSAAAVYRDSLSGESRSSYRSVSGLSMGGLPRGRLDAIAGLCPYKKAFDKSSKRVLNARTHNTEAAMEDNLKEALEVIKTLRATLYLAYHDRNQIDVNEVDDAMNEGRALLEKHGESDDLMDSQRG